MKNLKISNKLKAVVLAGSVAVLCGYVNESGKTDIEKFYDYHLSGVYTCIRAFDGFNTTVFDYKKFLEENNLVPLVSSDSFIEEFKFDDGYYLEKQVYDENSDSYYWKVINKEEVKVFSGIVHKDDDYIKNIYQVYKDKEEFRVSKVTDFSNMDLSKEYFVSMDDPIDLIDPEEVYYFDGKETAKVRK